MHQKSITTDDLFEFFAQVLAADATALRRIDESDLALELLPQGFVFTLPALHALLDPNGIGDYNAFRKRIYASTLNHDLLALQAEVVPFRASGKVDSSEYCLRRRQSP